MNQVPRLFSKSSWDWSGLPDLGIGAAVVRLDGYYRLRKPPNISDYAESRSSLAATTVSALDDTAASRYRAINGSNERQSPRLKPFWGRSAKTSNGFLFGATSFASLKVRFKNKPDPGSRGGRRCLNLARFSRRFPFNSPRLAWEIVHECRQWRNNREHPGSQELMWGLGDYPVTPEAHMRQVRQLGEKCLAAAERALPTVKKNKQEATDLFNYMKAYKLLADYYERKVLAAVAALIYAFGGPKKCQAEAEKLADEAVERYEVAIQFIWESMDRKSGKIKGRWLSGEALTLPEMIQREKEERRALPELFAWDKKEGSAGGNKQGMAPKAGTFVPRKP